MVTINKLDSVDLHRLHRKLHDAWRFGAERLAHRRYRMMARVYIRLHKALVP